MFDPSRHMMNLKGKDYLPVAARIAWFREDHPDWGIVTEPHEMGENWAIFRTSVFNAEGRLIATATKREDRAGFPDFLEKAECVPLDTEILTRDGWKRYDQLTIGEMVLSYSVERDISEWVPLHRVVTYEDAHTVRIFNGWGFDAICTPQHTWATRSDSWAANGKRYYYNRLIPTENLTKGHRIVTACIAPDEPTVDFTPAEAALFGWLMTDGTFRRKGHIGPIVYQSKPKYVAEIRELMKGFPHRECSKDAGIYPVMGRDCNCMEAFRWHLPASVVHSLLERLGISHESEVGLAIPKLSCAARAAMLDAMMKADGTDRGAFGKKRKPWVMPVYQMLAALQGHSLGRYRRASKGDVPIQRLKRTRNTYCSHVQIEPAGVMDVWCPTTKHGTWYARFSNGFTTITGNTGSCGRALALCGYGTLQAQEFDESPRIVDSPQPAPAPRQNGRANIATASAAPAPSPELVAAKRAWVDMCGEASIDDARARGELLNVLLSRPRGSRDPVTADGYRHAAELLNAEGIPDGFFTVAPEPESVSGEEPGAMFGPDEGVTAKPAANTSAIAAGL